MPIIILSNLRKILYWVISSQINKRVGSIFHFNVIRREPTRGQRTISQMPVTQTAVSVDGLRWATVHRNTALSFRRIPIEPICKCRRTGQEARCGQERTERQLHVKHSNGLDS